MWDDDGAKSYARTEQQVEEIPRHAAETLQGVREGGAQYGTFEDLRDDWDTEIHRDGTEAH